MNAYAILVCGGNGTRMGGGENKTLIKVGGVPACVRAYKTLLRHVCGAVVVVRAGEEARFAEVFSGFGETPFQIVPGGADRQASVFEGLSALPEDCDAVLVHDGARPLVSDEIVLRVLESVARHDTGIAARPVRDTVKRADGEGRITETLTRDGLFAVQTPQGFSRALLERAHREARVRMTDDAALVEALHVPVRLVMDERPNPKLTDREDVELADALCMGETRVGLGYDAHRLVSGRALVLCGVEIPYEKGLLGHSDADVALHALMDAMLGAAALGDIGQHFSDKDPKYLGISSLTLLSETAKLLKSAGYALVNADVTIVAQAPKLASYIPDMRKKIAETLSCDVLTISVKATTTERMGFEGTGEGMSAQAVALIRAVR